MRADTQEEEGFSFDTERETVILSDPTFPEVLVTPHLLDLKRGMPGIGQKEGELFSGSHLNWGREGFKFFLESSGPRKGHSLRSLRSSSTLEKV